MESSESEDQEIAGDVATEKQEKEEVTGQDLVMKAEGIEVVDGAPSVCGVSNSASKSSIQRFVITEKAPTIGSATQLS